MILGVLLAAGTGSRFESGNKLLSDLDGQPVVRHAARTLVDSPVDEAVAVVGHEAERVSGALADLPIEAVHNPDYEQGQSASVRIGAREADARNADAAVFALGDMPAVAPQTYKRLLGAYEGDDGNVVVPTYEGQRGNPVVFGRTHFDHLAALDGDSGGRQLFAGSDIVRVACDDPGVLSDVDTVSDLADVRGDRD